MVPISNTPALFTCNKKRVIANLSLWTNTSTSSRPNFSTVWATILRIVRKAQNQRNYFFLCQRLFSSGEEKEEGQMDLWELAHIQIHEPPRHFAINVLMIKWHLQQSSSFATSPWMMRGGVPSHLGHWRLIGRCKVPKDMLARKFAFYLLQNGNSLACSCLQVVQVSSCYTYTCTEPGWKLRIIDWKAKYWE